MDLIRVGLATNKYNHFNVNKQVQYLFKIDRQ